MYNDDDFNDEEESESSQSFWDKLLEFYEANKKLVWILGGIIVFILIFSLFTGGGSNNPVTPQEPQLTISSYSEKIGINNSIQLFASVEGKDLALFRWSSSNPSVATVSDTGVVTGINLGTSIITVTYVEGQKTYTEKCEVIVAKGNPNISVQSVSFQKGEVMITLGDTFTLPVIVTPPDGYVKNVAFTSYNKDVVTISDDGVIKALKVGKATVKVTINDNLTSEINVQVLNKKLSPQIVVNPTRIEFVDKLLKIQVNERIELDYTYEPYDITLSSLSFKSSDQNVVSVSNGVITGINVGRAEITVEALNGVSSIMSVEVVPQTIAVEEVQVLSETNITLNVGGVSNIIANVSPADATNKNLIYTSSNSSVASVDSDGNIKGVSAGSATITITSEDGNKTAKVSVTVNSSGSSGGSGGSSGGSGGSTGGSSGATMGTVKIRDKNDQKAFSKISEAKKYNYVGPVTISVATGSIDKIGVCVKKCTDDSCSDKTCTKKEGKLPYVINFTEGKGLYVIRITKYLGTKTEDTYDFYVNITDAGSTETKSCWLVNGSYKWTTESEAKKADEDAIIDSKFKTQSECEGGGSSSISKSFSINKEVKAFDANKTGYITRLRLIGNSLKKVYYCYGASCTINTSSASSASTASGTFGTLGTQTYYKSLSSGKTYYFSISETSPKYFYVSGNSAQTVKLKAEYSDGTYSSLTTVSLTAPAS